MLTAGRGLHFDFASASASSPKRSSLRFHCCVAVVVCVLKHLFHSMCDGLDGLCSNFHFGRRAAPTLKVPKRLSSFLDDKFRAPLILKVGGGTAWTNNVLRGLPTPFVWQAFRRYWVLADFQYSWWCWKTPVLFLVRAPASFARALNAQKKSLPEPAVMCALRLGGSVLGHWSVENAGDLETAVVRVQLAGCINFLF